MYEASFSVGVLLSHPVIIKELTSSAQADTAAMMGFARGCAVMSSPFLERFAAASLRFKGSCGSFEFVAQHGSPARSAQVGATVND